MDSESFDIYFVVKSSLGSMIVACLDVRDAFGITSLGNNNELLSEYEYVLTALSCERVGIRDDGTLWNFAFRLSFKDKQSYNRFKLSNNQRYFRIMSFINRSNSAVSAEIVKKSDINMDSDDEDALLNNVINLIVPGDMEIYSRN